MNLLVEKLGLVGYLAGKSSAHLPAFIDRDDIEGQIVLRLVRRMGAYDPAKGSVETFIGSRVWGGTVDAIRMQINGSQSRRTDGMLSINLVDVGDEAQKKTTLSRSAVVNPDPEMGSARHLLSLAARKLSRRSKRVLELYYFEGWWMAEIARKIGVNESRVFQIVVRARADMRQALAALGVHSTADVL